MTVTPLTLPSPLPNLLLPDWGRRVSMESSFSTDAVGARDTDAEERRALVDRPYRILTVTFLELEKDSATELWLNIVRLADRRTVLPLFQDQMLTTSSSSASTINVSTASRRLFDGARVVIFDLGADGRPDQVEYDTIATVNAGDIGLAGGLTNTYDTGSYVFPVIDVEISLANSRGVLKTDAGFEVSLQATEVTGPSALDATVVGNPAGFSTYLGLPVLDIDPNWASSISTAVRREGESYGQGRGTVTVTHGTRPRLGYELSLLELNRTDAWSVLQFLESRVGRRKPFWFTSPQTLFTLLDVQSTYVDISAVGRISDLQDFLGYVSLVEIDGTVTIRGVDSVSDEGGGVWRLTFDATIVPPSIADITRVTAAHRVRLDDDSFNELWETDEHASFNLTCIDALDDQVVSVTNATPSTAVVGDIGTIPDLYAFFSAQRNAWTDVLTPDTPTPEQQSFPAPLALDVPQTNSDIDFMFDCRQATGDNTLNEPYLLRDTTVGAKNALYLFDEHRWNNGMRTIRAGGQLFGPFSTFIGGMSLENTNAPFWDATDGMTVFVCTRAHGVRRRQYLFREGVFEWDTESGTGTGQVKFFEADSVEVANNNFDYTDPPDASLNVMAVRWDPGVVAEMFINGGAAVAAAVTPAASINTVTRDTSCMKSQNGSFVGLGPELEDFITLTMMFNDLVIFKRALTDAEMDLVGTQIAGTYALDWSTVI